MLAIILMDYWWLPLPAFLFALYAQAKVSGAFNRYSQVRAESGMTGAQAARLILDRAGLQDLPVMEVPGRLSDHYDPLQKRLCLSRENYRSPSVAAVSIAAHEAGHALQHQASYTPLHLRMALVPLTGFASNAAVWVFIGGMFMNLTTFAFAGLCIYGILALSQLVTLPVEFDASRRAKQQLQELGMISRTEGPHVSRMLNAAAMTYVAAMLTSLLYVLQFALVLLGNRDR